ncbi:hypothetical protein O181_006427 [Austropuccinia psidii MF-1]|uniref:Reverse transcriptase Ty1/copia-type domain-containing protein n=1 Tax=Austropuccinia psidii MF-1 TaxID=1389203 RepID=A0A9Q3BKS6_9BASI|nr:hypothetical protein [Austropuccinia psidii MF-1]
MSNCNPVSTPLIPGKRLQPAIPEKLVKFKELGVNFRSAIGFINYLRTATRPDLSYAVSTLSQFLERPGMSHWKSFLHIIKYLRGTQNTGLVYWHGNQEGLKAYSDANWGNCNETHSSISGYLTLLNGNLVLWKTKKKPLVSISTAEAEYKAVYNLVSELLWLCQWS